jgi:hypothetical protein
VDQVLVATLAPEGDDMTTKKIPVHAGGKKPTQPESTPFRFTQLISPRVWKQYLGVTLHEFVERLAYRRWQDTGNEDAVANWLWAEEHLEQTLRDIVKPEER